MGYRTGFADSYLDPLTVGQRFAALPGLFAGLCRLEALPHPTHGYRGARADLHGQQAMSVLRVTSPAGPAVKPAILLMRSPHAREWINGIAVVEAAHRLLENYRPGDPDPRVQTIVRLLDRVEFMIVPEGNPDGARYSFFDPGRRMWRKNLRPGTGDCKGVDCNRNYPTFFGGAGASPDACTEIYHGPRPLSEPESANIADLVGRNRNILFAIDSHSSGQALFRPQPTGGTHIGSLPVPVADDAIYRNLEGAMNARIATVAGTQYATGSTSNHAGTSDEYFFFAHNIFGFDLECGRDFQPPVADALVAAAEVVEAMLALGLCAAGETGLDIEALLARRAGLDVPAIPAPDIVSSPADSAETPLPPEKWRRYRVTVAPTAPERQVEEGLALLAEGFDVDEDVGAGISAIVSEEELDSLRRRGAQVSVESDIDLVPIEVK
jgi:hypothetical protein